MVEYDLFLEFAVHTARAAGEVIRAGALGSFEVHSKGLRDLLTDVDLAAERTIVDAIHGRFPDHDILTEETPPDQRSSRWQWVIDPLDGTGNFSRRYPCFSTSVALAVDDEPVVGAVYDPMLDRMFAACRGGGATANGLPLHVSETERMIDTLIGMDWTRDPIARAHSANVIRGLMPACGTLRICGSAALGLCYVGAGYWDAYWHMSLYPWDVAAAAVIIREAEGRVTDLAGEPWRLGTGPCLASNGRLHETFRRFVVGEMSGGSVSAG